MSGSSPESYYHRNIQGEPIKLPVGKVVCVGRNYAAHARELNNPVPSEPILFIKPATSLVELRNPIPLPIREAYKQSSCHFETEIAILIGQPARQLSAEAVEPVIWGYGIALDLTLRDLQNQLKSQGHPWEIAKGFDGACPISPFIPADRIPDRSGLGLSLTIGDAVRQRGSISDMLTPIPELIAFMSQFFTLLPGDIVLTGTPEGVGPLQREDQLTLRLERNQMAIMECATRVV